MSGAGIETPYVFASLPKPLDGEKGQTHTAAVYGLRGSRKRRRHEVAIAVDGESVNIYNVQSQSLVTSYAIPPFNYLCCPPCSIVCKPTTTSKALRRTYLIIKPGPNDVRRRIVCFTENVRGKDSNTAGLATPERKECQLPEGDIVALDVVPVESVGAPSIVVTYRNGDTVCVLGDLSKTTKIPHAQAEDERVVEYATALDIDTAKSGILQDREDVLALLDQSSSGSAGSFLLCHMVRLKSSRQLRLLVLRDPAVDTLQTLNNITQLLISYDLPSPQSRKEGNAEYELHASSGMLYQLLSGKLNVYSLSGIVPKHLTKLGTRSAAISSFSRLSTTSVLALSDSAATLYETKYGSVQAAASLLAPASPAVQSSKRKREEEEEGQHTAPTSLSSRVIASFVDLGLVVGLSGNELMGLQLGDALRSSKRTRTRSISLMDVVCGASVNELHNMEMSKNKVHQWKAWKKEVDRLNEEDDSEGLERLVASDESLGRQWSGHAKTPSEKRVERRERRQADAPSNGMPDQAPNGVPNGHIVGHEESWPRPEPFALPNLDRQKVLYILGSVFARGFTEDYVIDIGLYSPKLLEWLALTGLLTASNLDLGLRLVTPEIKGLVRPGDIMLAVRKLDDDFELTHNLLSLPVEWQIEEYIQALRALIESFEASPPEDTQRALPAPTQTNGDVTMNDAEDAASEVEHQSGVAELALGRAMSALATGLEVRSDIFRVILERLNTFPPNTVTSTMRAFMSHAELIFLIHVLRIELAEAGWTSKYDLDADDGAGDMANGISEDEQGRPNDRAVVVIGTLLNCAVDAIGTSGWLVGLSSEAFGTEELLDSLRAEVSAGLEGCYEANTLATFLAEVERCEASTRRIVARKRAVVDPERLDDDSTLLPVGGRLESSDPPGKSGKKSKRVDAQEKSKRVGKYSLDRIRI